MLETATTTSNPPTTTSIPPTTTTSTTEVSTDSTIATIQLEMVHAVPIVHPEDPPPPDPGWDYLDLGAYVAARLRVAQGLEDEANKSARRSSVEVWYAGAALKIIRNIEGKDKGWVAWIHANRLSVTTCYQAMRLHDRSVSVEKVRNLPIGEARVKYRVDSAKWVVPGLEPPKAPKLPDTTTSSTTTSKESSSITDEATIENLQSDTSEPDVEPETMKVVPYRLIHSLTHLMDNLTDLVIDADPEEWRCDDHDAILTRLDTAVEVLQRARRAIKEANKPPRKRPSRKATTSETM